MYAYLHTLSERPLKHQGLGTGHLLGWHKKSDGILKVVALANTGELVLPFTWPETAPDIRGWHQHARFNPPDRELHQRWAAFQTEGCWMMNMASSWNTFWVEDTSGTHVLLHRGKPVRVSALERNCSFRFWESLVNLLQAGQSAKVWEPPPLIFGETERHGTEWMMYEKFEPFNLRYWGERKIYFSINPAPVTQYNSWDFGWRVPIGFAWRGHAHNLPEPALADHIGQVESTYAVKPLV